MKEIKCRICKKIKEVPDNYPFKTCVICRVKEKSSRRLKQLDKKFLKRHSINKSTMPRMLWNFSNFKRAWQWDTKPDYEDDYKPARLKWVENHVKDFEDKKIAQRKKNLKQRKDYARRFLRFDLYPSTFSREKCTHYRYMRMGIYEHDAIFQKEHSDLCSECHSFWDYNLDNNMLNAIDNNEPYVNPNQKPLSLSEDCSKFRTMIEGSRTKRDSLFCSNHHLSCKKGCAEWYVKRKKQVFKGCDIFGTSTEEQVHSCPHCGAETPSKGEVCQDCINGLTR